LIHYFGIDFYTGDDIYKKIYNIFSKTFSIKGTDKVNESYTEILAIIIHSVIYSIITNTNFNNVISYEILFSNYQVAKIISHFECNTCEDILHVPIYQTTSVCSYYIVKSIFLSNLEKILNFWEQYGFFILANEKKYIDYYNDLVNIKSLHTNIINNMIVFINNNNRSNFVEKTMRMSVHQL
jgi:hypothetical protein